MIEDSANPINYGKLAVIREPTSGRSFFVNTPINYPHMTDNIVKAAC